VSGSITTRWGINGPVVLSPFAASDLVFLRAGTLLRIHVSVLAPRAPIPTGATVAEVTGVLNAKTSITWKVVSTTAIAAPSPWWKLFSG
jgi:hypothetical protein